MVNGDERKIVRRIQDELAKNPVWQVIVLANDWLCPYCGEIGAQGLSMDSEVELEVLRHLRSSCPSWRFFDGKLWTLKKMRARASILGVEQRIRQWAADDRRWSLFDRSGHWLCPYCAQSFDVGRSERVPSMARHIGECSLFKRRGRKAMLPEEELEATLEAINRRRRLRIVRKNLLKSVSWQLRDRRERWLCPYCAGFPGFILHDPPRNKDAEKILAHVDTCSESYGLEGTELGLQTLRAVLSRQIKRQAFAAVRKKILKRPQWQQRDLDVIWYCPYCAEKTDVYLPEAGVEDPAILAEVLRHLEDCQAQPDRENPRPLEEIVSAVEENNALIRLKRSVRTSLSTDPRFAVVGIVGAWACPYCCHLLEDIEIPRDPGSGDLARVSEKIARHLMGSCTGYPDREPMAVEQLSAIADGRVAPTLAPAAIPRPDQRILRDLGREVAALKSHVLLEREGLLDARQKQRRLLPQVPNLPGLEFGYYYRPCEVLGGDFYDFIRVRSSLAVAIGDISGHGIGAGLLMGLTKKLLEIHGRQSLSPRETLCRANRDIFRDLDARTFVTVFYSVFDPGSRRLRCARAGHNPLILYNPDRDPSLLLVEPKGIALGMDRGKMFDDTLEETALQLRSGDLVFQYTDGLTECKDERQEEFSAERLQQVIEEVGVESAEYVIFRVVKALDNFRGMVGLQDDVTMVAFKVL